MEGAFSISEKEQRMDTLGPRLSKMLGIDDGEKP